MDRQTLGAHIDYLLEELVPSRDTPPELAELATKAFFLLQRIVDGAEPHDHRSQLEELVARYRDSPKSQDVPESTWTGTVMSTVGEFLEGA